MILSARHAYIGAALVALVALAFAAGAALFGGEGSTGELRGDRKRIAAMLGDAPSAQAYQDFVAAYAARSERERHAAAHIFGELLYRKDGIDGVSACDSSFGFGCYHSFFGLAISERGPEVAYALDERCFETYGRLGTGCPHGIGHGLLWHLGDERLAEALGFCDGMRYRGPIGGCTDGVFMEYNDHTMATADGSFGRRPYDAAASHAPCDAVEARYSEACYWRQADWWYRSLGDIDAVAGLCTEVRDEAPRDACRRGLGYAIAVDAAYGVDALVGRCRALPGEGAERCLEGAAWAFLSDPARKERAGEVCAAAQDPKACVREAVLIQ